ncbi:RbsD/FucU domain-containing protein [Streptomyces diacarni]
MPFRNPVVSRPCHAATLPGAPANQWLRIVVRRGRHLRLARGGAPHSVVETLPSELEVDSATAARGVRDDSLRSAEFPIERFRCLEMVSHEELKERVQSARVVVRAREATPQVLLRCGVPVCQQPGATSRNQPC